MLDEPADQKGIEANNMAAVEEELCKLRCVYAAAFQSEGLQNLSIGHAFPTISIIGIGKAAFCPVITANVAAHYASMRGMP